MHLKRILLLISLLLISTFAFVIKPSADTVTDANIYIDTKKMVDTSWLSPSVNTYLDITAGAKFYSIGKYYLQYNVCFPKRDHMTITPYSGGSNDMTVKNTYKECTYSNNKTKGYTYSIIVKFNTWNGVSSNGSLYSTSSRVYFTSDNSSTVSIQLIDVTVLDENQLQIIDGLDTLDKNQQQTNEKLDNINNSINDSNVDDANKDASNFFDNFDNKDYGLSDIVKMPLQFINNISSAKCMPLTFPLPFVNKNAELPCMLPIYQQYFGAILTVYQTITFGIVSYWVCINLFRMVKNFKNPDNDEIEVFDL